MSTDWHIGHCREFGQVKSGSVKKTHRVTACLYIKSYDDDDDEEEDDDRIDDDGVVIVIDSG